MAVHYTPSGEWSIEGAPGYFARSDPKAIYLQRDRPGRRLPPRGVPPCLSLGLTGFVQNRRSEVVAEVQGDENSVARFAAEAPAAMPPAARIDAMTEVSDGACTRRAKRGFEIAEKRP